MSENSSPSPTIRSLSQALTALGAYAEEPTDAELATAEQREGEPALRARLSNALYGNALARTLDAEVTATDQQGSGNYRRDAWAAAGADNEGVLILQHYTAMRLAAELAAMHQRVSVDLGVLGAASGASEALKLLLEVLTVRDPGDPRAEAITTNLARAADQLETAAQELRNLFAAGRDAAAILNGRS